MTRIETAKLLAFIGARDSWAPTDHNVIAWHEVGTDAVTYEDAINRVLDHRPAHRISLCCVLGNCDPIGPHDVTAEEPSTPYRYIRDVDRFRTELLGTPLEERDFALMVKANGLRALEPFLAVRSGVR